jgi:hypothetical protein
MRPTASGPDAVGGGASAGAKVCGQKETASGPSARRLHGGLSCATSGSASSAVEVAASAGTATIDVVEGERDTVMAGLGVELASKVVVGDGVSVAAWLVVELASRVTVGDGVSVAAWLGVELAARVADGVCVNNAELFTPPARPCVGENTALLDRLCAS